MLNKLVKRALYKKHILMIVSKTSNLGHWYEAVVIYDGHAIYRKYDRINIYESEKNISKIMKDNFAKMKEFVNYAIDFDIKKVLSRLGIASCMKKRIERHNGIDKTVEYITLGKSKNDIDELKYFLLKNNYHDESEYDIRIHRYEGDFEYCFGFDGEDYEDKIIIDAIEIKLNGDKWTWNEHVLPERDF